MEFENLSGNFLTLKRSLSGGKIAIYRCKLEDIGAAPDEIVASKRGKGTGADISSVLFSFAGLPEAVLRKNDRGETQRLSMRMFLPVLLVDEIAVIDERSPILGKSGFSETAHKRAFSFMLSGKDDSGVITIEEKGLLKTRSTAQLDVITELLAPLEERAAKRQLPAEIATMDELEEAIGEVSGQLSLITEERTGLYIEREGFARELNSSETQIMALDELLSKYQLLDSRYTSDLERLDFIAEGAYFFDELQEVRCPLCDQLMRASHEHVMEVSAENVYQSARAEAGKILGHRADLAEAIEAVTTRKHERVAQVAGAKANIARIEERLSQVVIPSFEQVTARLNSLVNQRIECELANNERDQIRNLSELKRKLESALDVKEPKETWEQLPAKALRSFCSEIETILSEWGWKGEGRVDFDQKEYDIVVDGQSRQSHGKGVRSVLYAAFAIALLRYCKSNGKPHPGMVVIDSPLTSYKKGKPGSTGDGPVDPGIEASFWESLTRLSNDIQVIIVENKEPPQDVADRIHYQWFAGDTVKEGERAGLIPR